MLFLNLLVATSYTSSTSLGARPLHWQPNSWAQNAQCHSRQNGKALPEVPSNLGSQRCDNRGRTYLKDEEKAMIAKEKRRKKKENQHEKKKIEKERRANYSVVFPYPAD